MTRLAPESLNLQDRIVVVGPSEPVVRLLRDRHADLQIVRTQSSFEAMCLAAGGDVRGIVLMPDSPNDRRLGSVVAGLREAGGDDKPLVICCPPGLEPAARRALTAGADDYLIMPPTADELGRLLRLAEPQSPSGPEPEDPDDHLREIEAVVDAVAATDQTPRRTLDRLAETIALALGATGISLSVEGTHVEAGTRVDKAVLTQAIQEGGRSIGQIRLGPPRKVAYSQRETTKLAGYARLVARIWRSVTRQAQWRAMALTDEMTGVPNRRFLFRELSELLRRARIERFRVTVLMFDIDDFKKYNDTFGHQVGDEILREASRLFRQHCRQDDLVTRYGGDEFVVVFWDADRPRMAGSRHPESPLSVLRRFRKALESHEFSSLGPRAKGSLTISGGLATFPWDASDAEGLIQRADDALRKAKESGKNRIFLVGSDQAAPGQDAAPDPRSKRTVPDPSGIEAHKDLQPKETLDHGVD